MKKFVLFGVKYVGIANAAEVVGPEQFKKHTRLNIPLTGPEPL